jgi:hypothetical protein
MDSVDLVLANVRGKSSVWRGFDVLGSLAGIGLGSTVRAKARLVGAGVALRAFDDGIVLARRLGSSLITAALHAERIAALGIALLDDLPACQRTAAARGRAHGARRRGHLRDTPAEAQQERCLQHALTIRQNAYRVADGGMGPVYRSILAKRGGVRFVRYSLTLPLTSVSTTTARAGGRSTRETRISRTSTFGPPPRVLISGSPSPKRVREDQTTAARRRTRSWRYAGGPHAGRRRSTTRLWIWCANHAFAVEAGHDVRNRSRHRAGSGDRKPSIPEIIMRLGYSLSCSAVLLAVVPNPASAKILTVNVGAYVAQVYDPSNVLGGQIAVGQAVSGAYSYETTVPNTGTGWQMGEENGEYVQNPGQGRMSFSTGPFTFACDPASPSWGFRVGIHASYNVNYQDTFRIMSDGNKPVADGVNISLFFLDFSDYSGVALNSAALLTTAPSLVSFPNSAVYIFGYSSTGYYSLMFQIDSVQVDVPELVISPASSSLIGSQHIDPVLLLQPGTALTSFQGTLNGIPLATDYLNQCLLAPANAQNRPALRCPDIVPLLGAGVNRVEWRVDQADGSTFTKAVEWELIQ